ncbi:MAG: FmdB family zinc ribbon protein [Candidatus Geothermincolia bacterium]
MPRYDYKCKKCDRSFEVTHGINDTVETCDECGGDVRRVFHPVGIVFKGSGFYATDSKKPDNKPGKPYSEAEKEMEKATSKSEGNGKKDKPKDDKKSDPVKTEKTAS